jgi:hypothetical protein
MQKAGIYADLWKIQQKKSMGSDSIDFSTPVIPASEGGSIET